MALPNLLAGVVGEGIGEKTKVAVEERMRAEDNFRIQRE